MRCVSYEEWKKERKSKFAIAIAVDNSLPERLPGRRPRDPEKETLLIEVEMSRRQRWIETGKLEIIGPRHWKYRVDFKRP